MARKSITTSVSFPAVLVEMIDKAAGERKMSRSAFIKLAVFNELKLPMERRLEISLTGE